MAEKKDIAIFDPEGSGYDDIAGAALSVVYPLTVPKPSKYIGDEVANDGAFEAWVWHPELKDYVKHQSSRNPETGQILKGKNHPTFAKTIKGEEDAGYEIYKGQDGKYYSRKKAKQAVRLDQIQSDVKTRGIRLTDIPDARLTPDELNALVKREFDYADKERVTLRDAQRKVGEQVMEENHRRNMMEVNKVFGTNFDTSYKGPKDTLTQGVDLDKFTVGQKMHEAAKAVQRGAGQALKLPGVALKAIGEMPYNRQEIQDKKRSDWALQRIHGAYLDSKMGKTIRQGFDMLRRAGNAYIDKANSMMLQPSAETKAVMEQPFTSAPFFRTAMAVGESAPTYGAAVAATLTTGNPWAGLAVIGTTTAGSSYDNLRSMGVDPDLALVGAAIEGSIEVATEKIPMDELMKGGARPLLVRALRLGSMESFQELFAQMGQNYVDAVVKETDPKDYSTMLKAARQEWQTIINGWEDAMAAGFIMGGGASVFSQSPETYMSKQEMVDEFGILPQQDQDFLNMLQGIRDKVDVISKQAQQEIKEAEKPKTYTEELAEQVAPKQEVPGKPQRTKPLSTNAMLEKFSRKIEPTVDIQIQFEDAVQREQYDALLEKANAGDKKAIRQLSEFIQATALPTYEELLVRVNAGDISALTQIQDGNYYGGDNAKVKLTIPKQKLESIKYNLESSPELSELGGIPPAIISDKPQQEIRNQVEQAPEKPAEPVAEQSPVPEPVVQTKPDKGLLSKLTDDEYTELERLEKQFRDKISTQLSTGLDPELFVLATKIGSYYVRAGYRSFSQWAAQVKARVGNISNYTLRTVYANLRNEYPDLDPDTAIDEVMVLGDEIGEGEEEIRSLPKSTLALAVEKELIQNSEELYGSLPTYQRMSMEVQADKAAKLVESDLDRAKRIAFYQEVAPPDLFPENVVTALSVYATMQGDTDLMMELVFNEKAATVATTLGKRIKSLDTGQGIADPIRAIKEVIEIRKEAMASKGQDVSALEAKLRELQDRLDSTQRKLNEYTQQANIKAKREYGSRNTIVSKVEYESIIARRKQETAQLKRGKRLGAAYVPTPQDFSDLAKIGMYHLEALGRDFAKWSFRVTKDLGDWATPHLKGQYDKLIQEAEAQGNPIPESKRLEAKKKRLATGTKKAGQKFDEMDFTKEPRLEIELDEEGQKLQDEYDAAKSALKVAQEAAAFISPEEAQTIAQLAKDVLDRKTEMQDGPRRKNSGGVPTKGEQAYGDTVWLFLKYKDGLLKEAGKKSAKQMIKNYLSNPVDFLIDLGGAAKSLVLSLDKSFHFNQGRAVFFSGITGDWKSAKIWWDDFWMSFQIGWKSLKGEDALRSIFSQIISDPDYATIKGTKIDTFTIEEELPSDWPRHIPILGRLFGAGEDMFLGSSYYVRYQLAVKYLDIWRKSKVQLTSRELESLGKLVNSTTLRGEKVGYGKGGFAVSIFTSVRAIRGAIDILTMNAFSRDFSLMARKQAAIRLLRYISGAAMILALAKWIDDDSVTLDPKSPDFGQIKIGNTRFNVLGSVKPLMVLVARILSQKYTSSTSGKVKDLNTGTYGQLQATDLIWNFVENKFAPATQFAIALMNRRSRDGEEFRIEKELPNAITPLLVQQYFEAANDEQSADMITILIADALGIGVTTYGPKEPKNKKKPVTAW